MDELTMTTFFSLDGVMQAPGAPKEDPSGNFSFGGWLVPHADAEMGKFMTDIFSKADAFLLADDVRYLRRALAPGHGP